MRGHHAGKPGASLAGGLAAAVPLELKGLWKAHRLYGRAEWASLVSPAASLARNGFPAHPYLVNALNESYATCARPAACPAKGLLTMRRSHRAGPLLEGLQDSTVPPIASEPPSHNIFCKPCGQCQAAPETTKMYTCMGWRLSAGCGRAGQPLIPSVCALACRLLAAPGFMEAFFKPNATGGWRVPAVNETCCVRPALAELLDEVGAQARCNPNTLHDS